MDRACTGALFATDTPHRGHDEGVDAVAVEAVLSVCTDQDRAREALRAALVDADPRFSIDVVVENVAPGTKAVTAHIKDDAGIVVSTRTLRDRTTGTCLALVSAIGAWAQMVFDDVARREPEVASPSPVPAPVRFAVMPVNRDEPEHPRTPVRTYEVGTTLFLRNGLASTGGVFGVSPFVTVGFSDIWIIRPAFVVGTSTSKVPPDASRNANVTVAGGRLDFCRRFPGNYLDHRGIEFDACAGGDLLWAKSEVSSTLRSSVGPSAVLRGELGSNFGLELRGMLGANLARTGLGPDAPFFVASAEVGGSVRFQ